MAESERSIWPVPTVFPGLDDREVHVWQVRIGQVPGSLSRFESVMTPEEIERAGRFRFPADRERYVTARGLSKWLLAYYVESAPEAIVFTVGRHGKPELVPETNPNSIRFNLTHSGDVVLCALSAGRRVGVDVEQYRDVSWDELAVRVFSPSELNVYASLPAADRERVFFSFWTRKEAYIKAVGGGLTLSLSAFSVSLDDRARVIHASDAESVWIYESLDVGPGYAAAVAAEGDGFLVRTWCWSDALVS
jgi:4'-phosphopantetheinyl transferase